MPGHNAHPSQPKDPNKWYVHDEGKVTAIWDMVDKCEALSQSYSYMRLGLYYRTKSGMQPFCHAHLMWPMTIDAMWKLAWYTAPGDSALTISTSRNRQDLAKWTYKDEGVIYDAAGHPITSALAVRPSQTLRIRFADGEVRVTAAGRGDAMQGALPL